jgi:hypothetical protein
MREKLLLTAVFSVLCLVAAVPVALAVEAVTAVRGGGVELEVPEGWAKVERAAEPVGSDPRTLLVVGTKGARPIPTPCQVASYRVPADGAVVVVIGWSESYLDAQKLELTKLRRPTFACFEGGGAVGQVSRKGRDYQISIMVGDDASPQTIREAFAVARSFSVVQR